MMKMTYPLESEITLLTAFQDADPMGVIYHGNYFRFFEEARRVMMEKIDFGYTQMSESGFLWPVIDAQVKYIQSIGFNCEIRVNAQLTEWENRLRVAYQVHDAQTGKRLSKGQTTQVAIDIETKEMRLVSPRIFTQRVEYWHKYGIYDVK